MAAVWRRLAEAAAVPGRPGLWARFTATATATAAAARPELRARLRDSRVGVWMWSLVADYREACKEIVVGARDNPWKASLYCLLLGGAATCAYYNPSEKSFQESLLESSNQLLVLSPLVRSCHADRHIQKLVTIKTQGRLRHVSLGVFSLVYTAPYDPDTSIYGAHCEYLRPRWSDFPDRVLDLGFLGKWWVLVSKMKDWDINDDEFAHLPAELRTVTPQDLHSAENERLFELKFKPIILREEDMQEGEGS
ncbi:LOW QUALITY PROTEIN: mitochondrial import inner membrane translocase subunit Tim29 [Leucoraja erinacea]|uniref:LOW QUALITY PROTEIN: mitochondrial import inner membrane translocase subunit Tim29 n=1 Tax=Leucoraja erinaceus TaxID=7782 RepID=UPI002453BC02|nr:LOW QUALITY PROTEIN: mitochondrial import inner membrane translocase subunit Tim29 [Leucoraja erinacea]